HADVVRGQSQRSPDCIRRRSRQQTRCGPDDLPTSERLAERLSAAPDSPEHVERRDVGDYRGYQRVVDRMRDDVASAQRGSPQRDPAGINATSRTGEFDRAPQIRPLKPGAD
ncbi:MAG TPA: hypothetical protein VLU24_03955, partial [Mycobacterium sp.]|nr:hypothetical protein [Mycobacterium sp.]